MDDELSAVEQFDSLVCSHAPASYGPCWSCARKVVQRLIAEEREACAKLAAALDVPHYGLAPTAVREAIAAANRGRAS